MKACQATRPTSVFVLAALLAARPVASQTVPPDGANYRLNEVTDGVQTEVALATVNSAGEAVAVWSGPDGAGSAFQNLDLVLATDLDLAACRVESRQALSCQRSPLFSLMNPRVIALGDVDGDFDLDVVAVPDWFQAYDEQYAEVCQYQFTSDQFDCRPFFLAQWLTTRALALEDLNVDGVPDVVVARNGEVEVCLGVDQIGFACNQIAPQHNYNSRGVAIADLNGDRNPDAVFANLGAANTVCYGDGIGDFSACPEIPGTENSDSRAVALGDVDGDGKPDAVFANYGQPSTACLGTGSMQAFSSCESVDGAHLSFDVALAHLDADQYLDIAFANDGEPNRACHGGGPGWGECDDIDAELDHTQAVAAGDIDRDGLTDLVFANDWFNESTKICWGLGELGFNCTVPSALSEMRATDVAIADFFATGLGIHGRRLDATGPLGPEYQVNSDEYFEQRRPAVASNGLGRYVVTWQSGRSVPNDGLPEIRARLYDSSGALTPEFPVTQAFSSWAESPAVAMDAAGNSVVVWQELTGTGDETRVVGRIVDSDGSPLGVGFLVGGPGTRDARPRVAMNPTTGEFLVVWKRKEDQTTPDIVARLFGAFGLPLGDPVEVSSTGDLTSRNPDVTIDEQGNYLVVWDDSPPSGNGDVSGRRIDTTGTPAGAVFRVNTSPPNLGVQSHPRVAIDRPTGDFLVAWQNEESQGETGIHARWFASDFEQPGITPVWEFAVDQSGSGNELRPAVAAHLAGNFTVAWEGASSGDDPDILAQRYAAPVRLTINDISILEGPLPPLGPEAPESPDAFALFTVQASKPHPLFGDGAQIHVDFHTIDNTATYLGDYEFTQGSLTFVDGAPLALPVLVPIIDDSVFEGDESFFVSLVGAENAVVARPKGLARIIDNDPPEGLSIGDVEELEGDSGTHNFVFEVTLGKVQEADALVSFATRDCPGLGDHGSAQAGSDYEQTSGVLGFPAGTTIAYVAVPVLGDVAPEPDEDFCVDLYDPLNATLLHTPGVGTIQSEPGESCLPPISVSPTQILVPVAGDMQLQVDVTDEAACEWTVEPVAPGVDWIHILEPVPGEPQFDGGAVIFAVDANPLVQLRNAVLTIADKPVTVTQDGTGCPLTISPTSQSFPPTGGDGQVALENIDDSCAWSVALDPSVDWVHLNSTEGLGAGALTYSVDPNPPGESERTIELTIGTSSHQEHFVIDQDGDFFDHFNDEILDPEWLYLPDASAWTEAGSFMTGYAPGPGDFAQAIADPAFRGCIECTIEAALEISIFSSGDLTLYGWYYDDDNYVALTMNEFWNTWTLTERVGGVDVHSSTANQGILVGVVYEVAMDYDGATLSASVNGQPIAAITPAGTPDGAVGLRVDETRGAIDRIRVITFTESARLFQDGFESGDFSDWDLTVP